MYLLDTDVLSNLLRRAPSTALITRLASVPPEQQFTSSITLGEIVYGAHRLKERTVALLQRLARAVFAPPPGTPPPPAPRGRGGRRGGEPRDPHRRRRPADSGDRSRPRPHRRHGER